MPRIPPQLLLLARKESPYLPPLLRECRDLPSSRNELRWLSEHALEQAARPTESHLRRHDKAFLSSTTRPLAPVKLAASDSSPSQQEYQPHLRRRPRSTINQPATVIRRQREGPRWLALLRRYVKRREKGEPLQYITGTQPFGELEILCRRGVLIPRAETETYVSKLGRAVGEFGLARTGKGRLWARSDGRLEKDNKWGEVEHQQEKEEEEEDVSGRFEGQMLRVLDLCTGTGCIPLHLYEMLSRGFARYGRTAATEKKEVEAGLRPGLELVGVDISAEALRLARENLEHNISLDLLPTSAEDISFLHADVLSSTFLSSIHQHYHRHLGKSDAGKRIPSSSSSHKDTSSSPSLTSCLPRIDILTANPPYISPTIYNSPKNTTTRSVRRYEPKLALVPDTAPSSTAATPGDQFYHHIIPLIHNLDVGVTVLEIGDSKQARRVVDLVRMNMNMGMRRRQKVEAAMHMKTETATATTTTTESETETEIQRERQAPVVGVVLETWFDNGRVEVMNISAKAAGNGQGMASHPFADEEDEGEEKGGEISARAVVIWRREWADWRRGQGRRRK